ALAGQITPPERWIAVDDGSTDGTLKCLRALEPDIPFLTVVEAPRRPEMTGMRDRLARAAPPRTFNIGLATVDWRAYTHIMKLDGDIELAPTHLRDILC